MAKGIVIKKESDTSFVQTINNNNLNPIEFNGNYPYKVRFIDPNNNIDDIVYDHSFSIETTPNINSQNTWSGKVEIYDNTNNKLLQSLTYPAPNSSASTLSYKYETHTTVPSTLRIVVKSTDWYGEKFYSTLKVVDTVANSSFYEKWGSSTNCEFTVTPGWGRHIALKITEANKFVRMTSSAIRFYRSTFSDMVYFKPCGHLVEIYQLNEDNPTAVPSEWTGATMWSNDAYVRIPQLFLTKVSWEDYDSDERNKFMTVYTKNMIDVTQGINITWSTDMSTIEQESFYELDAPGENGLSKGFTQNVEITVPDSKLGDVDGVGYYIEKVQTPLYSIKFNGVKVRKYNTGSYTNMTSVNRAIFDSNRFDIEIDPSNISASGSTIRKFSVSGLEVSTAGSATAWYQRQYVFNPHGYITASDHCATISAGTYSLAGDIYGQVLTGGNGNWTVKIYNNAPVNIKCQYYSKKSKDSESTFDKTIVVTKNSNSGNLTLQDQSWWDDKYFRVQAIGWYSTFVEDFTSLYGSVKKIPDDNSKGYLY